MGSSMAENHPVGFQWVLEAREKNGAKVIHVDPRFTRTSAMSDYWLPLRAGTDLAFLGAMINYVIDNDRFFREYVVHYTNAATILRDDFKDTEDLDGLFSGWKGKEYDPETWSYAGAKPAEHHGASGGHGKERGGAAQKNGEAQRDEKLQHSPLVVQG